MLLLDKLQTDIQPEIKLAVNVVIVATEIDQEQDFTQVELKTTNSTLKKLEFEVPATQLSQVKAAIAQELGLSPKIEILQTEKQIQVHLAVDVVGIITETEIEQEKGVTKVEVKTGNSALKKLEFEFPVTELSKVRAAIAQELGLSAEDARILVSYRVKNSKP